MNRTSITTIAVVHALAAILCAQAYAQKPTRVGTTAASFLEVGYGAAGNAMGDAYVSMTNDVSAIYWNPAGLANLEQTAAMFTMQPWIADIATSFTAVGLVIPNIGTLGLGLTYVDYGEMEVTNLAMQEGTGEKFASSDLAVSLSYARKLVHWFAFGASAKYVSSSIWHTNASAIAFDLGVIVNTAFFSPSGEREHGMNIGMSISNYGTPLKYEGLDLVYPIDILPGEGGNYQDLQGQFRLRSWELPLIFRIGAAIHPLVTANHEVTIAVDALHPNNNNESVNVGGQYAITLPSFGKVFFRGGYKALFMDESQYGLSLGFGLAVNLLRNKGLKFEYAFRDVGIFDKTHCYGMSVMF